MVVFPISDLERARVHKHTPIHTCTRRKYRPRGYFTNGHVQVDAEKMSKSKGNFLMMDDCVKRFGADATR